MSDLMLKGFKTFHSYSNLKQLLGNEKIKLLKSNPKFADIENLKVVDSFVFQGKRENKENSFKKGKGIVLTNITKDIVVRVIQDNTNNKTVVSALSLEKVNDEHFVKAYEIDQNNQLYEVYSKKLTPELKDEFESNFIPVFQEEKTVYDDEIVVQDWLTDGCLPGGYLWCGKGCSNFTDRGGDGSVINSTDSCCKSHDYCYRYNWDTVDGCDDQLCACAQGKSTTAAFFIRLWFCD